ncbi:hypothetical protein DFP75_102488 [Marinomonas alcarazii]|uniref:Heavy-metal-binding protein n=1 Tax=Marinomonas alcarazii TaxID=491949 RepID=A0A318V3H4_9GAMM|nr:hypothetical protein [Marinomonas alcarazii]PYF83392.1 hypothetical protein DFP75_102488 [Marinomonas alcarazii]
MERFLAILMLFSASASASDFLGFFTTDLYPVDGCKVIKTDSMYSMSQAGTYNQYNDGRHSYLNEIDERPLKSDMLKRAIGNGFNAILGYQFNVYGGFSGNQGQLVNGSLGVGVYTATARGVPVNIICK